MVRITSILVGGAVVLTGGIIAVILGFASPFVTPSMIPVDPSVAIIGAMSLPVIAGLLGSLITAGRWHRTTRSMGFEPNFGNHGILKPEVTAEVEGRTIRVYTYNSGGNAEGGSGTTYTHIEAELDRPVEWSAIVGKSDEEMSDLARTGGPIPDIGPDEESMGELPQMGKTRTVHSEDGIAVWGDLSEERAKKLLTPRVKQSITSDNPGVAIGDAAGMMIDALTAKLEEADGHSAMFAQKALEAAEGDRTESPKATVACDQRGLVLDATSLESHVDLVVAAADAAERA